MKKFIIVMVINSLIGNALFSMEAQEMQKEEKAQTHEEAQKEFFRCLLELPKELKTKIISDCLQVEVGGEYEFIDSLNVRNYSLLVAFSPDSKSILVGEDFGGTAWLWDIEAGKKVQEFAGHKTKVTSVAFSPDGKSILTGSWDKTARLWDVKTGKEIKQFTGHTDWVTSVAFSPDGKNILTASKDCTARLWDVETGKELRQFTDDHTAPVYSVAFSPSGKAVLTGSCGSKPIILWDSESGQQIQHFNGDNKGFGIYSVACSPNGKMVLAGGWKIAWLWDVETGKLIKEFKKHEKSVTSVAFSPDGKTVLTGSQDRTAWLWDVETGKALQGFSTEHRSIYSVAFSSNGTFIVLGCDNAFFILKLKYTFTPQQKEQAYKRFREKGFYTILKSASQEDLNK